MFASHRNLISCPVGDGLIATDSLVNFVEKPTPVLLGERNEIETVT